MEFKQKYYKSWQILKLFSISKATFYRWQNEWISKGYDPALMGKVILGPRIIMWDAEIFLNWLQEYKVQNKTQFDYEQRDKLIAIKTLERVSK